ncbi:MAG: tRNA dihydrouridine(20/20a) synthase DusA [Alphaproteobacteria bacterium]
MTQNINISRRFSVAPMMDWTDRHCRYFHRLITRHALLYTEMVTANAVIHGDRERLLGFDAAEHPLALQLGGSEPQALAEAARIGAGYGYDEINLNVGCPSDRVQSGCFGAALMAQPDLVARCVEAMQQAVDIPVTVKCRIGIDDQDEDADFRNFIETVTGAGITSFAVHARKAWLSGLSPAQNRDVPPLNYQRVYDLKQARPDLEIVINGGVPDLAAAQDHLSYVDGVMLGRAAYKTPWMLADVDQRFFGHVHVPDRQQVIDSMVEYAARMNRDRGTPVKSIARHMVGLFQGERGARAYRRALSDHVHLAEAGAQALRNAASHVAA